MLLVFFFCANFSEMETRFGKKTRDGGVQDAVEDVQEVVEEAFVDKPQDLELVSVGQKPKKQMKYSPRKLCKSFLVYYFLQKGWKFTHPTSPGNTKVTF